MIVTVQADYMFHSVFHIACADTLSLHADPGDRAYCLHKGVFFFIIHKLFCKIFRLLDAKRDQRCPAGLIEAMDVVREKVIPHNIVYVIFQFLAFPIQSIRNRIVNPCVAGVVGGYII